MATEVSQLETTVGPSCEVVHLSGTNATSDAVLEEMKKATWVHFACHAFQHVSLPLKSAFLLTGTERLELSDIIRTRLPHAEFAFLSACQTATGDASHPDESVHLAAAMQLAGFRSVVATMWNIEDRNAPHVAQNVYERLMKGERAGHALHHAMRKIRKEVGERNFRTWVPYIHVGY